MVVCCGVRTRLTYLHALLVADVDLDALRAEVGWFKCLCKSNLKKVKLYNYNICQVAAKSLFLKVCFKRLLDFKQVFFNLFGS